jgi:CMP-N-acetylneuraminic acid synthetase
MPDFKILALIPARSGSKGLPNKNIRQFGGKPLLAHSIEHALNSKFINRTIVSTDSIEYADIARQFGAETPFLRPAEFAQDLSTDLDVFQHAIHWLKENEEYIPDICVQLRPTHPIRNPWDIDQIIQILIEHPEIDSVRSIVPTPDPPYKMWFRGTDGFLKPVIQTEIKDAYNQPRQFLPKTFLQNASIDAVRTRVITEMNSMTGERIYGYVMEHIFDIDTEAHFVDASRTYDLMHSSWSGKRLCIDIDGVIATLVAGNQYNLAQPRSNVIQVINWLYVQGCQIILFTARGSATGIDWQEVTRRQMLDWGVKYHELLFGKPHADYYIDDKMMPLEQFYKLIDQLH